MDDRQFATLKKKLDTIIALLAADKVTDKSKKEAILMLHELGIDNTTIAALVGTTPSTVAVRLSEAKKTKGSK
jgi:DNA-directed RNA polymerase specialized sigma24 family protein